MFIKQKMRADIRYTRLTNYKLRFFSIYWFENRLQAVFESFVALICLRQINRQPSLDCRTFIRYL